MIHPEITVTLTLDDIKLYDRAKAIGLPSIVISMYGDRIKKLLAEERADEREACAQLAEGWQYLPENNFSKEQIVENMCKTIAHHIRERNNQ
jgi:uncharacterized protein YllA (UPF0747 family)